MYPHERSLVKRLADKPFALIGVNSDADKLYLKKRMKSEGITWRSFWNGPLGIFEMEPFSKGSLAVAEAVAENDQARVAGWLQGGLLRKVDDALAADLLARDPQLWAVVVAPWVLVQERAERPA